MILLSIEAKDDISEVDPVLLYLEYDVGICWLEVTRCGVRMMARVGVHWEDGSWWRRVAETTGDVMVAKNYRSSSDEIADLILVELASRVETTFKTDREAIRAALDEARVNPIALALEVMGS